MLFTMMKKVSENKILKIVSILRKASGIQVKFVFILKTRKLW